MAVTSAGKITPLHFLVSGGYSTQSGQLRHTDKAPKSAHEADVTRMGPSGDYSTVMPMQPQYGFLSVLDLLGGLSASIWKTRERQ